MDKIKIMRILYFITAVIFVILIIASILIKG